MIEARFPLPHVEATSQYAMTINGRSTIVANRELLCCNLSEGAVILDLKSGVYYGLDEVGTYIWAFIQEPRVVSDIATAVLEEYAVDPERCEQDLKQLFFEMTERNLIEVRNE